MPRARICVQCPAPALVQGGRIAAPGPCGKNVLMKSQKGEYTLRMPEGREGEGLGEAEGLRVVRMGGRYICGSSIGGSGIDIVLSSICTLAQSSELAFRAEYAGGGG